VAAPLYHMNALCTAKLVLAGHASMVLMPQFRAPAYIEAVARYRCTWISGVPTMLALIARESALLSQVDLSFVERIAVGSAPLARVKVLFPQAALSNGYGTTEPGPVTFGREHPRRLPCPEIALGFPVAGIRLRLVQGDDLEADEGELQLWTPALMRGYHGLP